MPRPGKVSQLLDPGLRRVTEEAQAFRIGPASLNPLIPYWFGKRPCKPAIAASQHGNQAEMVRFLWRTLCSAIGYRPEGAVRPFARRATMAWKTPKIVEVSVGMEINMYACAARK
jgi:coenzyme PQQ precursor peptide PqqA